VRWPSGLRHEFSNIACRQFIHVSENGRMVASSLPDRRLKADELTVAPRV
jgi:hypothetical protein